MNESTTTPQRTEGLQEKKRFDEPRLTYVTPRLKPQGKVGEVTQQDGGFFGTFSP